MTLVGCETPIPRGGECQIPAVGRCFHCGQAFCDTHRARTPAGAFYADFCASCLAASEVEKQDRLTKEIAVRAKEKDRIRECLVTLDRAGVRPQERSMTTTEYKSFGRSARKVTVLEPAWPVGNLSWKFPETHMTGESVAQLPSGITRDLQLVPMNGESNSGTLEAWSQYSNEGPYGNDAVRHQVLKALERIVARLRGA